MNDFKTLLTKTKLKIITNGTLAFYSHLFLHLPLKSDDKIESLATDGYTIAINPDWFVSVSSDERIYALVALVMHIALKHPIRGNGRNKELWQAASDIVVNNLLNRYRMILPPHIQVYKEFEGQTAEVVYNALEQMGEDSPQRKPDYNDFEKEGSLTESTSENSEEGQGQGNGQSGGVSNQDISQLVDESLTSAKMRYEMSSKDSSMNGYSELKDIFLKLEKPKLPWNKLLRRYIQSSSKEDYSYRKPSRRFQSELILPSLHSEALSRIDFIIDTSGSISNSDFSKMLGEIDKVLKEFSPNEIGLSQFDHQYHGTEIINKFTDASKIKLKGGGGTCIKETLKEVDKLKTELIIIFTDGYMNLDIPKVNKEVIWIIYNNDNFKQPFGNKIHYTLK